MLDCPHCNGKGISLQEVMVECPTCNGKGEYWHRECFEDYSVLVGCSDCEGIGKVNCDINGKPILKKREEDECWY